MVIAMFPGPGPFIFSDGGDPGGGGVPPSGPDLPPGGPVEPPGGDTPVPEPGGLALVFSAMAGLLLLRRLANRRRGCAGAAEVGVSVRRRSDPAFVRRSRDIVPARRWKLL